MDTRRCTVCLIDLPLDRFSPADRSGRLRGNCKACASAAIKARRNANPELMHRQRSNMLKHFYGITLERYEEILQEQDNKCAVCKSPSPGARAKFFAVDHNHECCPGKRSCGKCVRGLLCTPCNMGIGLLKESRETLTQAIDYLDTHNTTSGR